MAVPSTKSSASTDRKSVAPRRASTTRKAADAQQRTTVVLQRRSSQQLSKEPTNELKQQASVSEPVEDTEEGDAVRYKVGCWDNRGSYFPVLDWAQTDKYMQDRFKALVEARNMEQIRILLHSGVSPNMQLYRMKRTPLHRAVELGDELLCQLLLSFKADPLLEDDNQRLAAAGEKARLSPMDMAENQQQLHLIQLFKAHLGESALLDVGPDARLISSDKPIRIHLRADEPRFMSSKAPFF